MQGTSVPTRIYRFGPFELSAEAAELRKSGVRLKLQDQPFQVLYTLLEHPGELVSREQLRSQLWPEGTFVDFEHGLNTAIKKIRDVLNDDPDTPRYIETIPRKGYRFIAPLSRDGAQSVEAGAPPIPPLRKWRAPTAILAVCIVLLVVWAMLVLRRVAYSPFVRISATRQLTFDGDLARLSAIETDGRRIFYFKYANNYLYSLPVNGGEERSYATKFVQPVILHISPDGSLLLVKELTGASGRYASRIWMVPTNGGPARPLGDIEAEFAAWSPDGRAIAFAQHNALYLTDDEGTTSHRLVSTPGVPWWIRWSPDGQRLRFTLIDSTTSKASIWEF
jgi:DNA-binding winged helix-turn-helix (wHTH) protein/dipeptidyl aminopeptidase/acylaminoacyl peptidase